MDYVDFICKNNKIDKIAKNREISNDIAKISMKISLNSNKIVVFSLKRDYHIPITLESSEFRRNHDNNLSNSVEICTIIIIVIDSMNSSRIIPIICDMHSFSYYTVLRGKT